MLKKISMKNKLYLLVDVETAGSINKPLVYDLGFAVVNGSGDIIESYSFIISEIFDQTQLMQSAYYAKKIPTYIEELKDGLHKKVTFSEALKTMNRIIKEYDLEIISAYNLAFDLRALEYTSKVVLKKSIQFEKMEKLCIWGLACELIFTQKTYQKVALREGWYSPAKNLKTTAEHAYRYITGDYQFMEAHKGLEDVEIEAQILAKCIRQRKKSTKGIIVNPWKIPNRATI
jgi:hypothetical protein